MSIFIGTYSNPYKINKENYWNAIKNGFHLCASQTLVNGLADQYFEKEDDQWVPVFFKGKCVPISRFINCLCNDWESDAVTIKQRAIIDNAIENMDFSEEADGISLDDVKSSLKRNRRFVLDSVRIMFELNMNPANIKKDNLTIEQKCVVRIYETLVEEKNKYFILNLTLSNDEIDEAINNTVTDVLQKEDADLLSSIDKSTIVVHGIHQFNPLMLRIIELLSNYKTVIILFNYNPDYKNVYQTWINVYSWFESKINISKSNFNSDIDDYKGGRIANSLAAVLSGNNHAPICSDLISVLEFDNQTEFAMYVAKKFEIAEKERKKDDYKHSALYYMDEQFYSANSEVNEILKVFFPEQFGERNFLDYPIGHFFVSITNMWDPETQEMHIKDMNDVFECLTCGIISENRAGELASIFGKCMQLCVNETTIKGVKNRLFELRDRLFEFDELEEKEKLKRLEYYDVNTTQLDMLIKGLSELNQIASEFFKEFNDQRNDFKSFYKKIYEVLVTKVLEKEDLDTEFKRIVKRVLNRIAEINDVDANASFDCLRETMQIYLKQTPEEGKGAKWIVRNFEQIDGDSLRKISPKHEKTYHFACLSDQDMSITHKDEFPWPLDTNFFEVAQEPIDWKYQVFVTSRKEYKNFRRYALIYGLAYCRSKIVLSYIKNQNDKKKDLYYLLRIINASVTPYEPEEVDSRRKKADYINYENTNYATFTQYDLMKYRLCAYRFLLESAVEGNSVYKDEFLIKRYMEIVLDHRARIWFSGQIYIKDTLFGYLTNQMEELKEDFPFISQIDVTDAIRSVAKVIKDYDVYDRGPKKGKYHTISASEKEMFEKRENFLKLIRSSDPIEKKQIFEHASQAEIEESLSAEILEKEKYKKKMSEFCETCSSKDLCLIPYKVKMTRGE